MLDTDERSGRSLRRTRRGGTGAKVVLAIVLILAVVVAGGAILAWLASVLP